MPLSFHCTSKKSRLEMIDNALQVSERWWCETLFRGLTYKMTSSIAKRLYIYKIYIKEYSHIMYVSFYVFKYVLMYYILLL